MKLYDQEKHEGVEIKGGWGFVRWRFKGGLEMDLISDFMTKISEKVRTAFYVRYVSSFLQRNIKDGTVIECFTNHGSPWISGRCAAEKWLSK